MPTAGTTKQSESVDLRILVESRLPTIYGQFRMLVFSEVERRDEHVALIKGPLDDIPIVRLHSECLTGDLFSSVRCDCGFQLVASMHLIGVSQNGILIYLRQEGRGIGLTSKLRAYNLQDHGLDTVQANLALGLPVDPRSFSAAFKFLQFMGVSSIRLASNNPNKISAASTYGIDIVERIEIPSPTTAENEAYIQTKRTAMGHHIDEHGGPSPHIRFEASVIGVADVEKAAAWYRRVFDMMILEQRVPETVHMVLGHSHLILQAKSGQSEYRAGAQPSLLFKVEAVHAIVARCRSLGATIVRGPEKKSSGGWTAIVADDDDNQLSLDQDEPNQAAS